MSDWDERNLDQPERASETPTVEPPEPEESPGEEVFRAWPLLVGALIALAIGIGIYWMFSERGVSVPQDAESTEVRAPVAAPTAPPEEPEPEVEEAEPEIELPALSESDAFVRSVIEALSRHPQVASFLLTEGLVRKIVATVATIAEGGNAARLFRELRPEERFAVTSRPPAVFVAPRSYRRYDGLVSGFTSIDARGLADAYRQSKPLFDEAFAELGYEDQSFEEVLARAISVLLRTPVVERRVELRAESVNYTYVDRRLESLTPPQKQLLRTGPENVRRVQRKLRELAEALELSVDS